MPPLSCFFPFAPKFLDENMTHIDDLYAKCSDLTHTHYSNELLPEIIDRGFNQLEYLEMIGENVKPLLLHGFFLRGGFDINVCNFYIYMISTNPVV